MLTAHAWSMFVKRGGRDRIFVEGTSPRTTTGHNNDYLSGAFVYRKDSAAVIVDENGRVGAPGKDLASFRREVPLPAPDRATWDSVFQPLTIHPPATLDMDSLDRKDLSTEFVIYTDHDKDGYRAIYPFASCMRKSAYSDHTTP